MKIWKLEGKLGGYETIKLVNFKKVYPKYFDEKLIQTTPLMNQWSPDPIYTCEPGKKTDCPHFWDCPHVLIFSLKAVKELNDLINKEVEFLPLKHDSEQYFAVHVLSVVDAIDYQKAKLKKLSSGLEYDFEKYAFIPELVEGKNIFRIYLHDTIFSEVFVSDKFKKMVESKKLEGFEFIEVWDSTDAS